MNNVGVHIWSHVLRLIQIWQYRPNDRICLFGFSRGAYTARCLAGMLHKVGLLPKDNLEQVKYLQRQKETCTNDQKGHIRI